MDEAVFRDMKPGDPDVTEPEWRPGLWGHMVSLVEIYQKIQDFHQHLSELAEWDTESIEETVRSLSGQLEAFEQALDPRVKFSHENLANYVEKGLGRVFIAFHLGFYHYKTLVFYQYLDRRQPATMNGRTYADQCKSNAIMVCEILRASREKEASEALYNIVGHVTAVSSSVLLHTYLFGEAHELPETQYRLESNLKTLFQLRSHWPSLERMIHRLVVFQNNCMNSFRNHTYRFDKWMVKFLTQHASVLEDKEEELPDQQDMQIWPGMTLENIQLERSRVTHGIMRNYENMRSWNNDFD